MQDPKKVDLFKILNLTPLSLLQKPHFVAKSGSFSRFGGCIVPPHPLTAVILFIYLNLFIYLFCCFMHGCLYSLSRLSIRELPIKNSLDFRGESILTPSPMPPLHNIHPVMVMFSVKLKLSYTLGRWTYPPELYLIECVGLLPMH